MKIIQLFLMSILLVSCGATTTFDYEKGTDFNQYKTYRFYTDTETGLSELDTKRIFKILDAELQAKGFKPSDNPDFFININSVEYQDVNRNTVGVGVGGTGRNIGGGVSVGIPIGQSNLQREMVFDFVDENGKGLFWQAVTRSKFNPSAKPEKREAVLTTVVKKALEGYPPQ